MPLPKDQAYVVGRRGKRNYKRNYEYSADVNKMQKWLKEKGYNQKTFGELANIGYRRRDFVYAKGVFSLYEAKMMAVNSGMSLYDFIDIFLSDIYPVTQEDFDILSEEDINTK